jgi:hypothetical protein
VASVQQPAAGTRFAFARGCRLRLKVIGASGGGGAVSGVASAAPSGGVKK